MPDKNFYKERSRVLNGKVEVYDKGILGQKIKTGFTISILVLFTLCLLSFYSFYLLINRSEWVNHTNNVLLRLESIISHLKDAETGQRGYLLSQNPDFLEPYLGSYNKVFNDYNDVRRLTVDNLLQQRRLDTLKILIHRRYNSINTTIELQKAGQADSAVNIVRSGQGKRIMDSIRVLVHKMEEEELHLREKRYYAAKTSSYVTPLLIVIASAGALVITIVFYIAIIKSHKQAAIAERNLSLAKQELEESYEELVTREDEMRRLNMELESRVEERTHEVKLGLLRLGESEKKYRHLVEGVKDYAMVLLDTGGKILSWNSGAERMYGYEEQEIAGERFSVFYPPSGKEEGLPEMELRQALQEGKFENEGWKVKKGGTRFWANGEITALYDEDNRHIGYVVITKDITEKKRTNEELRKVSEDLDTFIYTASHDLKAPISNLEGLFFTIQEELQGQGNNLANILEMMQSSIDRLKLIIDQLCDISVVQKGGGAGVQQVDLNELIREFKKSHVLEIDQAHARIYTNFETDTIRFDPEGIKNILNNLLTNSIRYRSPEREPEILVSTRQSGIWFILEVKDNGIGIDNKNMDKIFGLFKRMHNHADGTGMGLYLVKRIVENAGGKVIVESEPGKGTVFKLYFNAASVA